LLATGGLVMADDSVMGRVGASIVLTDAQVAHVTREISDSASVSAFVAGLADAEGFQVSAQPMLSDPRFARSLVRSLLVLAAFPIDGGEPDLIDIACQFEWSESTTYRYVVTWAALGVLEQNPDSHKYRRAVRC
jgi:hypothetical protein